MSPNRITKNPKKDYNYGFRGHLNSNFSNRNLDKSTNPSDTKITETDSSFHFELKIPGYIKEDFNFYLNNDGLVVTTERSKNMEALENDRIKTKRHSYCYASAFFKRTFQVPVNVLKDEILVDYKDEILSFDLLKLNS